MRPRWQFSLRELLLFMALLSVVVAVVAKEPLIASLCLTVAAPYLAIRAIPFVSRLARKRARWIMGFFVSAYTFSCVLLCLRAYQANEFDWRKWIALAALTGIGVVCACLAWTSRGQSILERGDE
jgi:hypothetical protein